LLQEVPSPSSEIHTKNSVLSSIQAAAQTSPTGAHPEHHASTISGQAHRHSPLAPPPLSSLLQSTGIGSYTSFSICLPLTLFYFQPLLLGGGNDPGIKITFLCSEIQPLTSYYAYFTGGSLKK